MILKKTVFVLGAGASAPYGFPLGGTLVEQIYRQLETSSPLLIRVHEMGYPINALQKCRDELGESARGIDAFLEKRQDYLEIGKACIAAALIPFEDESELAIVRSTAQVDEEQHSAAVLKRRSRRWYHYLLDHMLTGSFEDNQLAVVTCNFRIARQVQGVDQLCGRSHVIPAPTHTITTARIPARNDRPGLGPGVLAQRDPK